MAVGHVKQSEIVTRRRVEEVSPEGGKKRNIERRLVTKKGSRQEETEKGRRMINAKRCRGRNMELGGGGLTHAGRKREGGRTARSRSQGEGHPARGVW